MYLGFDNARTTRKRTYNDLATANLESDSSGIDEVNTTGANIDVGKFPEILLRNLLRQFEAESSLVGIHISQQRIREQRGTSAKILNFMRELMLKSTRSNAAGDEYTSCDYKELRMALEILVDHWGLGDIQIYNILIETLLQTYFIAPKVDKIVLLQEFILLDLLPCATGGDSENCHHLQSEIAKALMQALSKCGKNCCMYIPIVSWCTWYANYHQYHKPYFKVRNEALSNDIAAASFPIPGEINQLSLELLRIVPAIDLLPSALGITLDFFALTVKADSFGTFSLAQHSKHLILTLRQRWTELLLSSDLINDCVDGTKASETEVIRRCQRQLVNRLEIAIMDQDINQGRLLTDTYLKLLQTTSLGGREILESHLSYGTRTQIMKQTSNYESNTDNRDHELEVNILTIDWIFVMMILSSPRYQTMAITLIDAWCKSEAFMTGPSRRLYDSLSEVLEIVCLDPCANNVEAKGEVTEFPLQLPSTSLDSIEHRCSQQRLVPCLLQMATVLVLKPQRDYISHNGRPSVGKLMQCGADSSSDSQAFEERFLRNLFFHLDYHRQRELINMVLQITDECLIHSGLKVSQRLQIDVNSDLEHGNEDHNVQSAISTVVQSVFTFLHHIAKINPMNIELKGKLMDRLTLSAFVGTAPLSNTNIDREICILLVSLMKSTAKEDYSGREIGCCRSEVLILLQKLLFGESSRGNTTHAIRAMLLATELRSVDHYLLISVEEQQLIQEWVLRRLLPPTRRMIEPELGLVGLSFLDRWIDSTSCEQISTTKSSVFQHIKMMVANTGLVQVLENYRSAGTSTVKASKAASQVILAFFSPEMESRTTNKHQENPRAMLFGINYFLRRSNEIVANPSRWSHTADWVYALVDTYLQMGRTIVAKSWNPLSWLQASLEFPTIDISFFNTSNEAQRLIVEFIDEKICQFEGPKGVQDIDFFPGSYADLIVRRLFSKKLKLFIDSLRCFAVALLIGMSISLAVLKNVHEFSQTTNNISLDVQKFKMLQIIKIYDLRAKSTTMDSFFSSIDSALRRSWLRKKRVKLVLSDKSSDNAKHTDLSSTRSHQENAILHDLNNILKETRNLREKLFAGTKYMGCELLWSALKDGSGNDSIQKSLESLMCCKVDKEAGLSFLKFSNTIGTKLHIIQQILKQLENNSLAQFETTKTNVQYCFTEILFLTTWLAKLRKECAEAKRIKTGKILMCMDKSLSLLVHFTSSYLQVIAIFLRSAANHRSHVHRDKGKYTNLDLSFSEYFIHIDALQPNFNESDVASTTIRRLFKYFTDHLSSTEFAAVANHILEILSTIAIFDDTLMTQLFELSWVHLHTVYIHTDSIENSQMLSCPFAVTLSVTELARQSYTMDQQSNIRIINCIISKSMRRVDCYNSYYQHLHIGIIRHWGILTACGDDGFPLLILNFTTLVAILNDFLKCFNVSITRKAEILDSDNIGIKHTRTTKSSEAPPVVGLEAATFPEFFDTLMNLVIATLALGQTTKNCSTSNCQRVVEFLAIFRSLIGTYMAHIHLFPTKSAMSICSGSKDLLIVVVRQLQFCAEWWLDQPLLFSKMHAKRVQHAMAVSDLKELLDDVLSYTTTPILLLCEIWQTSTKIIKKSKLLSFRLAVEKAARQIKDISHSINFPHLSMEVECDTLQVSGDTEGFHVPMHNSTKREQSEFVLLDTDTDSGSDREAPEGTELAGGNLFIDDNDIGDNDSSFGVVGNWGYAANVDDDNDSICSLNIENSGSNTLPQKQNLHLVSR